MLMILAAAALVSANEEVATQAQAWGAKAKPFAICTGGPDCDTKWARAARWIGKNTRFKIAVDEPDLLSTPGAIYANTDLSFTMTKTARADGRYDLNVRAWCGNVFGCAPKPRDAISRLASIVNRP